MVHEGFIHYNHGWDQNNTGYPLFSKSKDQGFVKACKELLADPLQMQQWNEETPNVDTPTDQDFEVKQDGKPLQEAKWWIGSLKTWN